MRRKECALRTLLTEVPGEGAGAQRTESEEQTLGNVLTTVLSNLTKWYPPHSPAKPWVIPQK